MIVEAVGEVFYGFLKVIFAIVFIILLLVGGFFWLFGSSNQKDENIIKTKKPMIPDVEISVKIINGAQTSDTTYIYHVKPE